MTQDSFVRTLTEDPDHPGELILDLGDEICEKLGWQLGDQMEWIDNRDGSWTLRKKIKKEN